MTHHRLHHRTIAVASILVGTIAWSLLGGRPLLAQHSEFRSASITQPDRAGERGFDVASWSTEWLRPKHVSSGLQAMLVLAVFSLAPAAVLMTTSFVRIAVVLGLLRQALGTQQLPPNQVMTSIALFMTFLIMTPVWKQVYDQGIRPYADPNVTVSPEQAWDHGVRPVRQFMSSQIEMAGNSDDVWLFYEYSSAQGGPPPRTYDEVPLQALLPAFMLSEIKTAFLIGFQVYLPFLVVDLVVASLTMSMGMFMLPPAVISLPFKILLFVLVDGWHLVVGMLLESFRLLG